MSEQKLEDQLHSLIESYYVSPSDKCISDIRKVYSKFIQSEECEEALMKNSFLSEKIEGDSPFRTVRGQMWSIFLKISNFERQYHPIELTKSIDNRSLMCVTKRIKNEQERLFEKKSFQEESVQKKVAEENEYCQWLYLFVFYRWIYLKTEEESPDKCLEQTHYIFGLLFLRNFDLLTSFQAYVHLTNGSLPYQFFTVKESRKLVEFVPIILDCIGEVELANTLKDNRAYKTSAPVLCFCRVSSLNTQLKPLDYVEIIWDFLIIYGTQYIVFIEVAWILNQKDAILKGTVNNTTDQISEDWDPVGILKETINVFKKVHKYCLNEKADRKTVRLLKELCENSKILL